MGAYLPKPNTEKTSHDETHDHIEFGLSGMQGWRMSMEDAHSCMAVLDEKQNSLFGVFDGHGGKEVAEYVAQNFHKFLLDVDAYSEGDVASALKQAYLNIDEAITSDEVIAELKALGGFDDEEDEPEENEAAMLMEEAGLPLEELLERFKGSVKQKLKENGILKEEEEDNEPLTNGHSGQEDSKGKSRKQKKPSKRNLEEDKEEEKSDTKLNGISKDTSGTESSKDTTESKHHISKNEKTEEPKTGEPKNEEPKAEEPAKKEESKSKGSSSSNDAAGSSSGAKEPTLVQEDENDQDFDANNDDDDDSESEDDEDDDDDEEEEGSSDDDEFEDGEGVDFQPPQSDEVGKESGTTAVVAVLHNNKLYVANAGDSRCILCRNGKAVAMSFDHKPEDEIERARIEKAGGTITMDGRVNGGLNLSRAIGDHAYKQIQGIPLHEQAITASPDIEEIELSKDDTFMVLACDGIWNVMSNEEVIEYVHNRLEEESEEKPKLSKICEEILDKCLASDTDNDGSGCDNMTCLIVRFKHKDTNVSKRASETESTDLNEKSSKRRKVSS